MMRLVSVFAALLIAVGLWFWFVARHETSGDDAASAKQAVAPTGQADASAEPPRAEVPVPVVVLESTASETSGALVLRGRTKANRAVSVAAEVSGRVTSNALPAGTRVRRGDVLCRLNPGVRAAELAEAEAALAEAAAEANAATRLERKGFTAETTLRTRQAQLEAAQARVDRVRWDIAQLEILAPFSGMLESDTAEPGTLMATGSICAEVIDLSRIKVSGYVAEQEVDLLAVGQTAAARLINGVEATGQITFVSRMADDQTRTYAVEVTLSNEDRRIRDGMTTELAIPLPPRTAHRLPQSALTLNDEGQLGVRLDVDGTARFYPVEILKDANPGIWVAGLPDPARVIVVGQEFVRDGRRVTATLATPDDLVGATQ